MSEPGGLRRASVDMAGLVAALCLLIVGAVLAAVAADAGPLAVVAVGVLASGAALLLLVTLP